jgi:hypothetical protein
MIVFPNHLFGSGTGHSGFQPCSARFGHEALAALGVDQAVHLDERLSFIFATGFLDGSTVILNGGTHIGAVLTVTLIAQLTCN